jgi:hypothetical protein
LVLTGYSRGTSGVIRGTLRDSPRRRRARRRRGRPLRRRRALVPPTRAPPPPSPAREYSQGTLQGLQRYCGTRRYSEGAKRPRSTRRVLHGYAAFACAIALTGSRSDATCARVRVCVCVRACACACVRVCVCERACACVRACVSVRAHSRARACTRGPHSLPRGVDVLQLGGAVGAGPLRRQQPLQAREYPSCTHYSTHYSTPRVPLHCP